MPQPTIARLLISERARDKMWRHGIDTWRAFQVLANPYVVIRNRADRAADRVLIGRDDQGRCLTIPVLPTDDPYTWRAITAWPCKPGEAAKLR